MQKIVEIGWIFHSEKRESNHNQHVHIKERATESIYMRVGYVFDLRFSEWKIQPISTIFCILKK